ncbi:hypothetical protein, partial [Burkholderia sp. TSV86]|uniref:hypothetical protein n=1 Tax=Burkholderia sp. TSV86 TaxID=1385594 RepID=UPI001E4261E7
LIPRNVLLHVPADRFERLVKFRIKHGVHDPTPVLRNATPKRDCYAKPPRSAVFRNQLIILRANPGPDAGFAPDAGRSRSIVG